MKISKQAIMRASGWSETQYKREYSKFAGKIRNLNRLAGTHYNVRNELYYSITQPENATVRAIREMSSTRKGTTSAMRETAYDYVADRFRGLIRDNAEIKEKFEMIGKKYITSTGKVRKYSLRQFNAFAKKYGRALNKAREKYALVGSDEILKDVESYFSKDADAEIYQANYEEYENIFD